jgi:sortase A
VSFTAIRMAVGRVVLVAGILILLFIPYLLWGTGLQTARSQDQLRQEFAAVQRQAGVTTDPRPVAPAHPSKAAPPAVAPNIPAPAIGAPVGTIDIPKISLEMVVVSGTGTAQLEQGPGHYPGTPLPGEAGNVAIAGHRTTYLHPFYNLNELVPGDDILLTTVQGEFLYQMTSSQVVAPTDVAVVAATLTPQLTLTTCNPRYSASTRLVVHAALVASALTHAKVPVVTKKTDPVKHHNAPSAPAHNWFAAIAWGVVVAAVITAVWVGARKSRGGQRATVVVFGLLGWLVLVFFFFQAAAPLLPASF